MSIASAADSAGMTTAAAAAAAGEASTVSCGSGNSAPGAADSSSPSQFKTVTELTLQQPGSSNPVTGWHNDFVKVGMESERISKFRW
jgi:subtilisin family serine protease